MRRQESCRWKRPSLSPSHPESCDCGLLNWNLDPQTGRKQNPTELLPLMSPSVWPSDVAGEVAFVPGLGAARSRGAKGNFQQHHRWWRDKDQPGTGRRNRRQRTGDFPQQKDPSWFVASAKHAALIYAFTNPPIWMKWIFLLAYLSSHLFLLQAFPGDKFIDQLLNSQHPNSARLHLSEQPPQISLIPDHTEGICHKSKHTLNVTLNAVSSHAEIQSLDKV